MLHSIINQRQHCCVHDTILYNRIQQIVSLYGKTDFFAVVFLAVANAQRCLTNQTNIPISAFSPWRTVSTNY